MGRAVEYMETIALTARLVRFWMYVGYVGTVCVAAVRGVMG